MPRIPEQAERSIVLHADDFGMNRGVNAGILRGFTHGVLTSTSLLTNAPEWLDAAAKWKELLFSQRHGALASATLRRELHDSLQPFDLGVHLNLTQGRPVTGAQYPAGLLDRQGRFPGIGRLFGRLAFSGRRFSDGIRRELSAQIERLLEQGIVPTHLNGHQYIELIPAVSSVLLDLARRYSIPVVRVAWEPGLTRSLLGRHFGVLNWGLALVKRLFACRFMIQARRARLSFPHAYFGTGHAGRIDLQTLERFLSVGQEYKVTEIGWHPGESTPGCDRQTSDGWFDPLSDYRVAECRLLTGMEIGRLLKDGGFRLRRLYEVGHHRPAAVAA